MNIISTIITSGLQGIGLGAIIIFIKDTITYKIKNRQLKYKVLYKANTKTLKAVLTYATSNKDDSAKHDILCEYYSSLITLPDQKYVDLFAKYLDKEGFSPTNKPWRKNDRIL